MSTLLWRYYLEDDLHNFQRLLASANYNGAYYRIKSASGPSTTSATSPGRSLLSLPQSVKTRQKSSSNRAGNAKGGGPATLHVLTRSDINSRDAHGVTLLHHMASSAEGAATEFALALLGIPLLDLYCQDHESGWTALHRALYSGNVSIARALMDRDVRDFTITGAWTHAGGLIKIKDHEGNSPFDVYATTIARRVITQGRNPQTLGAGPEHDEDEDNANTDGTEYLEAGRRHNPRPYLDVNGDELFAFGSNKNLTLGFADEDDRQFPERVYLKRPKHLQELLHRKHAAKNMRTAQISDMDIETFGHGGLPALVKYNAIKIQDVQLSKLHTAILTTDPESNLYICGFGPGGRLGTGDEATRFNYTSILGGGLESRKITCIGLGQNHTIAVSSEGEVFSWGNNAFGQLGYSLASSGSNDEEAMQLLPRQVYGPLKREAIVGCAASRTHSVVFTSSYLYTFGKNDGQLGLVDSDARLLESQTTPRKVAVSLFSSSVLMASAIEKATVCLLENHDVWVFANYGYARVVFPLDNSNRFMGSSFFTTRHDSSNHIIKICSGGDTVSALSRSGEVFAMNVSQKLEPSAEATSTTNPAKIRGALSTPQRIWSLKKSHMAVRDVGVGQNGSVIICTKSGSVWRRVERAKIKEPNMPTGVAEHKSKVFKFSRIPGLTRVSAVRSNVFGAFAAVRNDYDVLKTQMEVSHKSLWQDLFPLLAFHGFTTREDSDTEAPTLRLWRSLSNFPDPAQIRHAVLSSHDIYSDLKMVLQSQVNIEELGYDVKLGSTGSDLRFPCHDFLLVGRSSVLRKGLRIFENSYFFEIPDVLTVEYDKAGDTLVLFKGLDTLTLIDIILYLYTDTIVSVWNFARQSPKFAIRYRQVRNEVMRTAAYLDLPGLEHAARLMTEPVKKLHTDLDVAILEVEFFEGGDVQIELSDGIMRAHRALICQRCPFFDGLFHGRAQGGWLSSRRQGSQESRELVKIDLQHFSTKTFTYVLRHIYSDADEEIFEEAVTADLDEFLDLILDVMAVANELMIDRLAQVCQKVLGGFVNTRNVCQLLNAVAPCSITQFKDAALEYICLNLEGMLENHLLEELDQDMMAELDQVIRENQLACLPIAKSRRAEIDLLERHPELVGLIEKGKKSRIDAMALQDRIHEEGTKANKNSKSPFLKPKGSTHDLMFNMDEDDAEIISNCGKDFVNNTFKESGSEIEGGPHHPQASLPKDDVWFDAKGKSMSPTSPDMAPGSLLSNYLLSAPSLGDCQRVDHGSLAAQQPSSGTSPWSGASLRASKLDLKEIMAQTSEGRKSNISTALSQPRLSNQVVKVNTPGRISQKERRKQKQLQQQEPETPSRAVEERATAMPTAPKPSPWHTCAMGPRVSLKDDDSTSQESSWKATFGSRRKASAPSLTMRQTVSGTAVPGSKGSAPGPLSPKPPVAHRSISSPAASNERPASKDVSRKHQAEHHPGQNLQATSPTTEPSLMPKFVRHNFSASAVEPSLQLSMADILAMQQTEKDIIKEATAKRSLQEIQEEQAFQEWWDQEEAATRARMEAEVAAAAEAATKAKSSSSRRAKNGESSRAGGAGGRGGVNAPRSRGRNRGRNS